MTNTTEDTQKIRKSIVCTFSNHAPIRFWNEFDSADEGKYIDDYIGILWHRNQDFGHHDIGYYVCKSGKKIYFASYNSGMDFGSGYPKTTRIYLKDIDEIKAYFDGIFCIDEWYRVCGKVDENLIVDGDLL